MSNLNEASRMILADEGGRAVPRRQAKARHRRVKAPDAVLQQDGGEGDSGPETGLSHDEILQRIMTRLTVEPVVAGGAFGLGRSASYQACHTGEIVALRMGHKLACPTAPLRRQLGLEPPLESDIPAGPPKLVPKPSQSKRLSRKARVSPRG
jgi:hypothetical protein